MLPLCGWVSFCFGHASIQVNDFWTEPIISWIAVVVKTCKLPLELYSVYDHLVPWSVRLSKAEMQFLIPIEITMVRKIPVFFAVILGFRYFPGRRFLYRTSFKTPLIVHSEKAKPSTTSQKTVSHFFPHH